jgi:hypothetical protein
MEINYSQQQKYSPDKFKIYLQEGEVIIREVSYDEIEVILRDISYVRDKCTDYLSLHGGQFSFATMLNLPYWEFLFLKGDISENTLNVLEDGILLIIALFYIEIYDDEGNSYLNSNKLHGVVENILNKYEPRNIRNIVTLEKIKYLQTNCFDEKIIGSRNIDEESTLIQNEIGACNQWLYDELVINYFRGLINYYDNAIKDIRSQKI